MREKETSEEDAMWSRLGMSRKKETKEERSRVGKPFFGEKEQWNEWKTREREEG